MYPPTKKATKATMSMAAIQINFGGIEDVLLSEANRNSEGRSSRLSH